MAAPKGNTNAEKWTVEQAEDLFRSALEMSFDEKYDFIGEIAKELRSYIDLFDYLIEKYPHLKSVKTQIMRNCEANCFANAKKGKIKEATAIVNLKSNHKWTDRADLTSGDAKIEPTTLVFRKYTDE